MDETKLSKTAAIEYLAQAMLPYGVDYASATLAAMDALRATDMTRQVDGTGQMGLFVDGQPLAEYVVAFVKTNLEKFRLADKQAMVARLSGAGEGDGPVKVSRREMVYLPAELLRSGRVQIVD